MKTLPHLTFLRSFEAAARHLSFTSAADELNYTQSAVSSHVRSLEEFIGRPLFIRHPRSLSLTDVGEAYLPSVRHALQEINTATRSIISMQHRKEVAISCPISLAENWFPSIIKDFNLQHPNISVTLHSTVWSDVEENASDISITIDHEDDADPDQIELWDEKLTLACAPDYLVDGKPLTNPAQIPQANFIHILGRPAYWERVGQVLNLNAPDITTNFQTNSTNAALGLAANGLGCVAAPKSLVRLFVARGLLCEPFDFDLHCPWRYYAKFKDDRPLPSVKLFQTWLLEAAQKVQL